MSRNRIDFAPNRWTEAQRNELRSIVTKWRERLGVDVWTIHIIPMSKRHSREPDTVLAQVDVSERYLIATIRVYPRLWQETRATRERAIMHELLHAPVNRVANLLERAIRAEVFARDDADDAYEQLTEHFTNIVWDAYERS